MRKRRRDKNSIVKRGGNPELMRKRRRDVDTMRTKRRIDADDTRKEGHR